jgi:hypothetical protein
MEAYQKAWFYDLLTLKRDNEKAGNEIIGLDKLIVRAKNAMEPKDVAYVEKIIAGL